MKTYKKVEIKEIDLIYCDRCKNQIDKIMEDYHNIQFIGGYNSKFGDNSFVDCDLCDKCMYELINDFCIINQYDVSYEKEIR